jgi:hypothetical protein
MKKVLLIISTLILLSVSGNCQWYNRRYGVNDISQLSQEQLIEALTRAQSKVTGGHVLSIVGAIGIGVGSYLIVHSKKIYPEANDITEPQLTGFTFLVISIPLEIAGLIKWGINGTRAKSIKGVLKSTELKTGLLNYHGINIYSDSQVSLIPCLSVIIHF